MKIQLTHQPTDRWSRMERSWQYSRDHHGQFQAEPKLRLTKRGQRVFGGGFLLLILILMAIAGGIERGTL